MGPAGAESSQGLLEWPPEGAEPLEIDDLYERLAALGIEYGPAFQGVRAAWSRQGDVFAEIELGEEQAQDAGRFAIHPALLDAAFHPILMATEEKEGGAQGPRAPFAWSGIQLQRAGAAKLRIALTALNTDAIAMVLADPAGQPLATVRSLLARPLAIEALADARGDEHRDSLFVVDWVEQRLPESEGEGVKVVELAPDPELDAASATSALCESTLAILQEAIAATEETRIAFLTKGAVAVAEGECPDLAGASVRALIRSAIAEHPGRFLIVDSDDSDASRAALPFALATEAEPQLALREGVALAPRLARSDREPVEPKPLDPEATVLITGGTGALGSLFARHLVTAHGARHLLLTSRRGPSAPRAKELAAELEELGAEVQIAACDVGERDQLEELLGSIPAAHPLGAVIHTAAVFENALIETLSVERLNRVLGAKAAAAWNLHELTRDAELSEFVLFSSGASIFDNPGQANYAAANAFLDALAQQRAAAGLAVNSIIWGLWATGVGGPNELMMETDQARLDRGGFLPMSADLGLELFERTRVLSDPVVAAVPLDLAALRKLAREGELTPIYSGLVRIPARRAAAEAGSLSLRLAEAPEGERDEIVVALIAEHVAAVLGHASGAEIDPKAAFKDLGFDSLAAVELRNRLNAATGLRLPSTLVFDYPSVNASASFVRGLAEGQGGAAAPVRLARRSEEPIAIVGMSCRYPGGVESPDGLWQLVASGADVISAFPEDRGWDLERLFHPDPDHPGTSYGREGGFLPDAAEFDAEFFGISPREAMGMDPQQRLLLEAAWEALEDAGIDPSSLRGATTGVFAGVMSHDYGLNVGGPGQRTGYEGATSGGSMVSGRVAYSLGLEGPALTIDTACSSSLVAMHLAGQALRSGECDLALAGGVTVASTPGMYVMFSRQRGLAPDGRCKPFAAAADGTGVSEGVGLVLLERLSEARRNGHEVLALMRGSATNQDGASNGLTAPNGPSQERVIRQALANAGLEPAEVDAVEAHGTGTTLGDPIEAQALLATYGQDRGEAQPLRLGAIKSNLGHAQAAAGVAGVIKMAQAMRHRVLPKTLHLDEPTPHVDWSAGAVELLGEARPWEPDGHPRRAGVSSFGLSGTNAHLILEEAPAQKPVEDAQEPPALPLTPLPLSAKSEDALREQAARLINHLQSNPELSPADVGFSLATTRATLEHRATVLGADREELLEALAALGAGKPHPGLVQGRAATGKLAFLFSGQGAQRPGMGKELYESESFPAFSTALDEICAELDPLLGRSLKELLFAKEKSKKAALLDRTEFTQPALFAIEVALFRQLQAWGLEPDYLLGHSIGELSAAHVAGVLSLPGACKLIAARGALMGALPEGGAMVAIEAGEEEISPDLPAGLSIAGINAPNSVVVSGEESAALELAEHWKEKGRKTTRLRVSHAFHSELMEPMLEEFSEVAQSIDYKAPQLPVLSNLTGELLTPEQATDPAYWVSQVREPVRFADGAAHLAEQGVATCLELGPDGVLCAMAAGSFAVAEKEAVVLPLLRKDRAEANALLGALAGAQANGARFDWQRLFPGATRVPLPTYAFQRQRYWPESQMGEADVIGAGQSASDHPLLGAAISLPGGVDGDGGWLLTGRLSLQTHPWLGDHVVHGSAILPGTAFVEMALKAAEQSGAEAIEELTLEAPLILPEQGAVQVQVSVGAADEAGSRSLLIHSRPEDEDDPDLEWVANATGALGSAGADQPQVPAEWPPQGAEPLEVDTLYERVAELGVDYGPAFQGVRAAWRRGGEIFAEVEVDESQVSLAKRFGIHPALLDAALHPILTVADDEDEKGEAEGPKVPFAWNGVRLSRAGGSKLRVALTSLNANTAAIAIADPAGEPLVSVAAINARSLPADQLAPQGQGETLFTVDWIEQGVSDDQGQETRVVECSPQEGLDPAAAAEALCAEVLATLKEAIAAAEEPRIAFLTRGAMALGEGESPDPAAASVWGLVRSVQAEHPDRFVLVDSDGSEASRAALAAALAIATEPQLALREGVVLAPRLARAAAETIEAKPFDPEATVLLTGGTGGLGSLFARHLVSEHGARHLLLTSRRGPEAPGARELVAELEELGAEVDVVACDVAERSQLEELLGSIPADRPLGAVLHTAGVTDDGVVESLSPERLETAMAPKARAALHLHELTREAELSDFVLFSSIAGTFNSPGQGNYAAANAFLDALAQQRRAEGLAATSIAWGAWGQESEMTSRLGEADRARFTRGGIRPLPAAEGLELFDRARTVPAPFLLAVGLDNAALRKAGRAGELPPLFSGLVRIPVRRSAGDAGSLARRLAAAPEEDRQGIVVALVAEHVAAVLGHASGEAIDPKAPFKDLGFDSLGAVELRNRLAAATGVRLPSTLVFDYPSVEEVGAYVCTLVDPQAAAGAEVEETIDRLQEMLERLAREEREQANARIRSLLSRGYAADADADAVDRIRSASAEEILEIVNDEIGTK